MLATRGAATGRSGFALLLVLLALLLLGFWLRVHNLDAFSFWTDEGLTPERSGYAIGQILRNDIVIQGVVTKDTHPPLYYLIIHLTRQLFGVSDFAFRYPSVLFGVLLIPLLYQLARRLAAPSPSPSRREGDKRLALGVGEDWGEGLSPVSSYLVPSPLGRGLGRGSLSLGLLVALLAVVNPLHVYYSQEARMYTLLALLATGMSYVLWQALEGTTDDRPQTTARTLRGRGDASQMSSGRGPSSVVRRLLLYSVLAALALYTHYTIAFLIAAQALFWAWLVWRAGMRWIIIAAAGLGLLAAVPLIPYTLPRLLAGAEANYFPVSPLTMLQDVVRFFHLGLTVDFTRPVVQLLNWVAFGLLLLGVWAARPWRTRLFLLTWLLAAVLGLMLGSALFKPMYQGVRHIMAGSPAFLLLVGYGVWAVWSWLPATPTAARSTEARDELTGWTAWRANQPNLNPFGIVALALLLLGAALSLVALYTDPAYVKDDFRAIVRFIETRAGGNDVIVYNNAVLLPLHEHYRLRPDVAVTALPAYPQYATGQEPELAALAERYDRVWFITDPPADGRDDGRLIRGWLDGNLLEVSNRLFPARTTEARVVGYASAPRLPCTPAPLPAGISVTLTCSHIDRSPLTGPTLWVDLWWQGERPAAEAQLVFTLTGPDGVEQYRRAHALLRDLAFHWDEAAPNRLSYDLPLPPGLPPGAYTLSVGPQGEPPVALQQVEIASTDTWPARPEELFAQTELAPVRGRPAAVFSPDLSLLAVEPWDDSVIAGNNLPLTLFWGVGPEGIDLTNVRYRLEVIDGRGGVLRSQETRPGAPWLGRVAPGALLREVTSLYFRPETPPGRYRLRWTLLDGEAAGEPVVEGAIEVTPVENAP